MGERTEVKMLEMGGVARRRGRLGWQFALGLAVSAFFLYVVLTRVDLGNVARALGSANYLFVLPSLAVYFLGVAVRAVRWRVLLRPIKSIGARRLFPIVVIGYMANDVLPARMGEVVRAYVLGRDEKVTTSGTLATIFVERVFDGISMLLFVAFVAFLVPLDPDLQNVVRFAAVILLAVLLAALAIAASPSRALKLLNALLRFTPARSRARLGSLAEHFLSGLAVLQNPAASLTVLGLSVVAWLCEAAMYYILAFGFAIDLGFHGVLLTTAIANLGTMVPSSPGYVGTFEALTVFTLGRFAVPPDVALGYAVALHAVLLVPITLLGFFYMWRRHVRLAAVKRV